MKNQTILKLTQLIQERSEGDRPNFKIAIGGAGGSGKSDLAKALSESLQSPILSLDHYRLPRNQRPSDLYGSNPSANNLDLLKIHLDFLEKGHPFYKPVYNPLSGMWLKKELYTPSRLNIIEGELSLYSELFSKMDFTIFVDSHWEFQLANRIKRDIKEREQDPERVISVFLQSNFKDFKTFYLPQKAKCDIVVRSDSSGFTLINDLQ